VAEKKIEIGKELKDGVKDEHAQEKEFADKIQKQ
jgi:hypothetical protein